jgi:hypothetical protein
MSDRSATAGEGRGTLSRACIASRRRPTPERRQRASRPVDVAGSSARRSSRYGLADRQPAPEVPAHAAPAPPIHRVSPRSNGTSRASPRRMDSFAPAPPPETSRHSAGLGSASWSMTGVKRPRPSCTTRQTRLAPARRPQLQSRRLELAARNHAADLLVSGSSRRGRVGQILAGVALRLLPGAPCARWRYRLRATLASPAGLA